MANIDILSLFIQLSKHSPQFVIYTYLKAREGAVFGEQQIDVDDIKYNAMSGLR